MAAITDMHMDVVVEAKRHVARFGVETEISYCPEEDNFPYIITYIDKSNPERHGLVMLFPQPELYLTSHHLGFIIKHIRECEETGGDVLLVLNTESISRVKRILETTGITNHARLAEYTHENNLYKMDWELK